MGDADTVRLNTPEAVKEYFRTAARNGGWPLDETRLLLSVIGWIPSGIRAAIQNETLEHGFNETYWMLRDSVRFLTKDFAKLEFPQKTNDDMKLANLLSLNPHHFVHLSKDEPMYVAYTPDANYGKQDRQVKTTLGRYLKKFHKSLSDSDVRRLSDVFKYHFGTEDVMFAETEDDIIRVYTEGPHSCMAYKTDSGNYGSQVHPAAAYAAPGLRVAYQTRDGKINSRCLVYDNPDNKSDKRYIRLYGDEVLTRKLNAMGYSPGTLDGVKLRKIPAVTVDGRSLHGTYVCPYIDDVVSQERRYQGIKIKEDHLLVCHRSHADYVSASTNGLVGHNASYLRTQNETYRIKNPETGETEMSLEDKRYASTCSCCGSSFRMDTPEQQRDFNSLAPVCPSCVGQARPYVRAIVNSMGATGLLRRENALPLSESGDWVINDQSVLDALGICRPSPTYYPNATWVDWRTRLTPLPDGELIHSADRITVHGGKYAHCDHVITTARQIKFDSSRVPLMKDISSLRVDADTGWVRTVANSLYVHLDDWFVQRAANTQPSERRALLDATFRGEDVTVRNMIYSWWEPVLTALGHSDLINEARQLDLLCVEED